MNIYNLDNRHANLHHLVKNTSGINQMKPLKLYNALHIGYLRDENQQKKRLKAYGYRLIPELTSREYLNAYNPTTNKILHVSNGTNFSNATDIKNNLLNSTFGRSASQRTAQEKNSLNLAKQMYPSAQTNLVGHSLGAQYSSYIGTRDDKVTNYNPHLNFNSISRPNTTNYRTGGDLVSIMASNAVTLPNSANFSTAHNLSNIKNSPIFI